MQVECWRCDPPALVAALTDPALLARYQAALGDELPISAERTLVAHLRRMLALAARAQAQGFDQLARTDTAAADALLTDLFAVATWHGWELPAERLAAVELDPAGQPRGLLGADCAPEGAALWPLDATTLGFARVRQAVSETIRGGPDA